MDRGARIAKAETLDEHGVRRQVPAEVVEAMNRLNEMCDGDAESSFMVREAARLLFVRWQWERGAYGALGD